MRGTLVFDGNCGFCTRSRGWLRWLDRAHRVATIPFQHPDAERTAGVDRGRLAESAWWLDEDGARYRGAEAVNAALSAALGTRLPLHCYRLPGIRQAQDAAYQWVADNRHRLPGSTPWCVDHPADCADDDTDHSHRPTV